MGEKHYLEFGDVNKLAKQIRNALGVDDYEPVGLIFPQFDRDDGKEVTVMPSGARWLDTLKTAPESILKDIGLQLWDEEMDLWLFPAEWYDYIPEGYEAVNINGKTIQFFNGITDNDKRFGALSYGIVATQMRELPML